MTTIRESLSSPSVPFFLFQFLPATRNCRDVTVSIQGRLDKRALRFAIRFLISLHRFWNDLSFCHWTPKTDMRADADTVDNNKFSPLTRHISYDEDPILIAIISFRLLRLVHSYQTYERDWMKRALFPMQSKRSRSYSHACALYWIVSEKLVLQSLKRDAFSHAK